MIANSAFLAAMVVLVLLFELLSELSFLAPLKRVVLYPHLELISGAILLVFLNLFAAVYGIGRRVWLKDTGRKLALLERQLRTGDTVVRDLSERLSTEE